MWLEPIGKPAYINYKILLYSIIFITLDNSQVKTPCPKLQFQCTAQNRQAQWLKLYVSAEKHRIWFVLLYKVQSTHFLD